MFGTRLCFYKLVAISMKPLFSSNTLHIPLGSVLGIGIFFDWSSDSKLLTAITSKILKRSQYIMIQLYWVLSKVASCKTAKLDNWKTWWRIQSLSVMIAGQCLIYPSMNQPNQHQYKTPNHVVCLALTLVPCPYFWEDVCIFTWQLLHGPLKLSCRILRTVVWPWWYLA